MGERYFKPCHNFLFGFELFDFRTVLVEKTKYSKSASYVSSFSLIVSEWASGTLGITIPDFCFREGTEKGNIILQVLKKSEPEASSFTFSNKKGILQQNIPQILTRLKNIELEPVNIWGTISFSTKIFGLNSHSCWFESRFESIHFILNSMWVLLQKYHHPFLYLWIKGQVLFCPAGTCQTPCMCSVGMSCGLRALQLAVSLSQCCTSVSLSVIMLTAVLLGYLQRLPHGGKWLPPHMYFQSMQQLAVTLRSRGRLAGRWRMHHLRLQLSTCFHSGSCSQDPGYGFLVPSSTSAQPKKQWTCSSSGFISALSSCTPGGGQKGMRWGEGTSRISCIFPCSAIGS